MNERRITRIETFPVPPRWLFVRLETSDGLVGWGEASLEGLGEAVEGAIVALRAQFIGADPDRIEDIWQQAHRGGFYRGGPVLLSALAGLDQALWDIKGKRHGVPVFELLGGRVRDRMQAYAWVGGDEPSKIIEAARVRLAQGFKAVKLNATGSMGWLETSKAFEGLLDQIADVQALGLAVALDFHGRLHRAMAKQLARALEPFGPLFIEEPLLCEQPEAYQQLAGLTTIPIAVGERLYSRWDIKPFLETSTIDLLQPDLCHAGGISEVRRIAAMAEAYDVAIAPHCPLGPIALSSCLQVGMATPNFAIQEMPLGIHYNSESCDLLTYVENPEIFDIRDGMIAAPAEPGLGVIINEEKVRMASKNCKAWRTPVWRGPDGGLREW